MRRLRWTARMLAASWLMFGLAVSAWGQDPPVPPATTPGDPPDVNKPGPDPRRPTPGVTPPTPKPPDVPPVGTTPPPTPDPVDPPTNPVPPTPTPGQPTPTPTPGQPTPTPTPGQPTPTPTPGPSGGPSTQQVRPKVLASPQAPVLPSPQSLIHATGMETKTWMSASPDVTKARATLTAHQGPPTASPDATKARTTPTTRTGSPADSTYFDRGYGLYWSGSYSRALDLFRLATGSDDSDARAWYYRGLSELALGRESKGRDSIARAARLQATDPTGSREVDFTLRLVLGPNRLMIDEELARARRSPVVADVMVARKP